MLTTSLRRSTEASRWRSTAWSNRSRSVAVRRGALDPGEQLGDRRARQVLPRQYGRSDVVFNIGRVGLLAAALANGTVDRLGIASQDRLHQERRLVDLPESADALQKARDGGAYCAWLSGSGPTVAALCDPSTAGHLARQLPEYAEIAIAKIDHRGARCQ